MSEKYLLIGGLVIGGALLLMGGKSEDSTPAPPPKPKPNPPPPKPEPTPPPPKPEPTPPPPQPEPTPPPPDPEPTPPAPQPVEPPKPPPHPAPPAPPLPTPVEPPKPPPQPEPTPAPPPPPPIPVPVTGHVLKVPPSIPGKNGGIVRPPPPGLPAGLPQGPLDIYLVEPTHFHTIAELRRAYVGFVAERDSAIIGWATQVDTYMLQESVTMAVAAHAMKDVPVPFVELQWVPHVRTVVLNHKTAEAANIPRRLVWPSVAVLAHREMARLSVFDSAFYGMPAFALPRARAPSDEERGLSYESPGVVYVMSWAAGQIFPVIARSEPPLGWGLSRLPDAQRLPSYLLVSSNTAAHSYMPDPAQDTDVLEWIARQSSLWENFMWDLAGRHSNVFDTGDYQRVDIYPLPTVFQRREPESATPLAQRGLLPTVVDKPRIAHVPLRQFTLDNDLATYIASAALSVEDWARTKFVTEAPEGTTITVATIDHTWQNVRDFFLPELALYGGRKANIYGRIPQIEAYDVIPATPLLALRAPTPAPPEFSNERPDAGRGDIDIAALWDSITVTAKLSYAAGAAKNLMPADWPQKLTTGLVSAGSKAVDIVNAGVKLGYTVASLGVRAAVFLAPFFWETTKAMVVQAVYVPISSAVRLLERAAYERQPTLVADVVTADAPSTVQSAYILDQWSHGNPLWLAPPTVDAMIAGVNLATGVIPDGVPAHVPYPFPTMSDRVLVYTVDTRTARTKVFAIDAPVLLRSLRSTDILWYVSTVRTPYHPRDELSFKPIDIVFFAGTLLTTVQPGTFAIVGDMTRAQELANAMTIQVPDDAAWFPYIGVGCREYNAMSGLCYQWPPTREEADREPASAPLQPRVMDITNPNYTVTRSAVTFADANTYVVLDGLAYNTDGTPKLRGPALPPVRQDMLEAATRSLPPPIAGEGDVRDFRRACIVFPSYGFTVNKKSYVIEFVGYILGVERVFEVLKASPLLPWYGVVKCYVATRYIKRAVVVRKGILPPRSEVSTTTAMPQYEFYVSHPTIGHEDTEKWWHFWLTCPRANMTTRDALDWLNRNERIAYVFLPSTCRTYRVRTKERPSTGKFDLWFGWFFVPAAAAPAVLGVSTARMFIVPHAGTWMDQSELWFLGLFDVVSSGTPAFYREPDDPESWIGAMTTAYPWKIPNFHYAFLTAPGAEFRDDTGAWRLFMPDMTPFIEISTKDDDKIIEEP